MEKEKMTRFRIIALDYKLDSGFKGSLHVTPKCRLKIPKDFESHPMICLYSLQIESEEGDKEFHFNITGEGRFAIPEEEQARVREMDQELLDPIIRQMEEELLKTVNEITDVFHIKSLQLELATEEK